MPRRSAAELHVTADARCPEPVEIAAYYVASEALANAMKHAQASRVEISLTTRHDSLLLSVRDDGIGGSIHLHSVAGAGTHITVDLPLEYEPAQGGS
jgi:signal transduction histidine kinase